VPLDLARVLDVALLDAETIRAFRNVGMGALEAGVRNRHGTTLDRTSGKGEAESGEDDDD